MLQFDTRVLRPVHDLPRDVRFAARLLVKDRWFTAAAVFALSLGIAANSTWSPRSPSAWAAHTASARSSAAC